MACTTAARWEAISAMSGTRKVTCPECGGEGDAGEAAARMGGCAGLTRGRDPAGREGRVRARGRGGKRPAHSATAADSMAGPELRAALEAQLRDLCIPTVSVEHPEVFTVEEMMPHIQHLKGAHSKNLFLKDKRKKNYWLVTVLHDRKINLNDLAKQLGVGSGNLRFADEISMLEKLKVGQGCATPLALFCDQGEVRFVLDSAFLEGGYEKVYFHPMTNTATMGLSPDDFLTFVKKTGHDPMILKFN